jgi:hypothetical protein
MATAAPDSLDEITPEGLTRWFRSEGLLGRGRVESTIIEDLGAFNARVARLTLRYRDAHRPPPTRLVLKLDDGDSAEVAFYRLVTELGADRSMLVPCLAAGVGSGGVAHLLLADLGSTHAAPVSRERLLALEGVPTAAQLDGIATALARLHAAWWEHPLLGDDPATRIAGSLQSREAFAARWARHRGEVADFLAAGIRPLDREERALFAGLLASEDALWERRLEPRLARKRHLTLTHNDCYLTQFLSPTGGGATHLVDFQSVCTDFAAHDLVYLLATFWTREQRRRSELPFLERYHRELVAAGVRDYSREQLFDDYRLMLAWMLFHPVWDWSYGASERYWRPKLACLLEAARDWGVGRLVA